MNPETKNMNPITFNLSLPSSWEEMSAEQRLYVYFLLSEGYTSEAIRSYCLLRWSGIRVVAAQGGHKFLVQYGKQYGLLAASQVAAAATSLSFLDELPPTPTLPEEIDGHPSLPADMVGVAFQTFLMLENLYQGFLHTQDKELVRQMASVVYDQEDVRLDGTQTIAVFYWFASLKQMFRCRFSHFFQPLSDNGGNMLGSSTDLSRHLQEAMDAQIRALTKGDVTKEAEVLQLDTWRALTELNAQAKEYEELRRNNK